MYSDTRKKHDPVEGKKKNIMISGDIGCYTLAASKPYSAMDSTVCMGASISLGHQGMEDTR